MSAPPLKSFASVHKIEDPKDLKVFLTSSAMAMLWDRSLPKSVQRWLNALGPEALPAGRGEVQRDEGAEALASLFDECAIPQGPERAWLEADMADLVRRFALLMGALAVRLRLDVVESNSCKKFHIDAVTARLICTYRGTGTQYGLAEDSAEPKEIFTAPTGAPLLLKGTRAATQAQPLLHRSPPIEGTGEVRLLLVLDPIPNLIKDP